MFAFIVEVRQAYVFRTSLSLVKWLPDGLGSSVVLTDVPGTCGLAALVEYSSTEERVTSAYV